MMMVVASIARRRGIGASVKSSAREIVDWTREAMVVLAMPVIFVGGILIRAFTVTESVAIAVVYALVFGMLLYRTIKLWDLPGIFMSATLTTGNVMFILATASAFSWILARAGTPQQLDNLPMFDAQARPG